jgi:hypothetical protein
MQKFRKALSPDFEISPENNDVDILAAWHDVKQGIEAERFRAVQPLVQVTNIAPTLTFVLLLRPSLRCSSYVE